MSSPTRQPGSVLRLHALEGLGTCALAIAVVGSGAKAEQMSGGNSGLALLINCISTATALFVLILTFAQHTGAQFNPIVSTLVWLERRGRDGLGWGWLFTRIVSQGVGAVAGVVLVHAMSDLPLVQVSTHVRSTPGLWLSEVIATAALVSVARAGRGRAIEAQAAQIALLIGGAYWWASSTSFTNPALTFARAWTMTFCGIAPSSVPGFVLAQACGAALAWALVWRGRADA